MKILVATHCRQGLRKTDVCKCDEGAWIMYPPCAEDEIPIVMIGIKSLAPTTTFRAMDLPIEENHYIANLAEASQRIIGRELEDKELDLVYHTGKALLRLAEMHRENEILEICPHGSIKPRAVMPLYTVRIKEK